MDVNVLKRLPVRASLKRYQEQAASLIQAFEADHPKALQAIRQHHPRLAGRADTNDRNPITAQDIRRAGVTRSDAQAVVARWHGFAGWSELLQNVKALNHRWSLVLPFERAVEAIIAGDIKTLRALLRAYPVLTQARSTRGHGATLLHYVSANGVEDYRQKTPKNAVKVLEVLLSAGVEVDADLDYGNLGQTTYPERTGSTTLGLVATSVHPAAAGVQQQLLNVLLDAGACIDGLPGGWNPVLAALYNGRGAAAEFLARRGARLEIESAAGTGRLEVLKDLLSARGSSGAKAKPHEMELGFLWACCYGHTRVVQFLLDRGVNVAAQPRGETGLHWAAHGGHPAIVELLLERKAPVDVRDRRFGGTPLGWALHGWCYPPPEAKNADYHKVVALLVKAGSRLESIRNLDRQQTKKMKADSRMLKLLGLGKTRPSC